MAATILSTTKEYVHGPWTATVVIDAQPIVVAFIQPVTAEPDDQTGWLPAEWEGDPGMARSWRVLVGPGTAAALAPGQYMTFSRLTDSPEVPVRKHDILTVT